MRPTTRPTGRLLLAAAATAVGLSALSTAPATAARGHVEQEVVVEQESRKVEQEARGKVEQEAVEQE